MHCENYICKLEECICDCGSCKDSSQLDAIAIAITQLLEEQKRQTAEKPCTACGICPTCGRGPQYVLTYHLQGLCPTWYCSQCATYHPVGYSCFKWYSYPYTCIQYNTSAPYFGSTDINIGVAAQGQYAQGISGSGSISYVENTTYDSTL